MPRNLENLAATIENCDYVALTTSNRVYPTTAQSSALPLLEVNSPQCYSIISIQGAQLLSHRVESGSDLLWLSPRANFIAGKAVRGGIPICLPWFGDHVVSGKPKHGFARNVEWQLHQATIDDLGRVVLVWLLDEYATTPHQLFDWCFNVKLKMILGYNIEMHLQVTNRDSRPMPLSWALHSYHPVGDLGSVRVSGLDGCSYLDNTQALARFSQRGDVRFDGELDRIYLSVPAEQVIQTTNSIRVTAVHCYSAVVWNPGSLRAAEMHDIGEEYYSGFVCLERGNAAENSLFLAPGESHQASVRIAF